MYNRIPKPETYPVSNGMSMVHTAYLQTLYESLEDSVKRIETLETKITNLTNALSKCERNIAQVAKIVEDTYEAS